jgi:hypothetical protein
MAIKTNWKNNLVTLSDNRARKKIYSANEDESN